MRSSSSGGTVSAYSLRKEIASRSTNPVVALPRRICSVPTFQPPPHRPSGRTLKSPRGICGQCQRGPRIEFDRNCRSGPLGQCVVSRLRDGGHGVREKQSVKQWRGRFQVRILLCPMRMNWRNCRPKFLRSPYLNQMRIGKYDAKLADRFRRKKRRLADSCRSCAAHGPGIRTEPASP